MGGAYALDFGAILKMADAMEVETTLLARVLPDVERAVISGLRSQDEEDDDGA